MKEGEAVEVGGFSVLIVGVGDAQVVTEVLVEGWTWGIWVSTYGMC